MSAHAIPTHGPRGGVVAGEAGVRLSLQRLEDLQAGEARHRAPHRHPFHTEVVFVEDGRAAAFIEGRAYRLGPGDLYAIPAGVLHGIGRSDSLRGWAVHCLPELLAERADEVIAHTRRGRLAEAGIASQRRWVAEFAEEYAHVRRGRAAALRALLRLLGVRLRRLAIRPDAPALRPQALSVAFRELLDEQFARERNPAHYALQLGVTVDHLRARVREETGSPPRAHIDRRVVLEAERLLAFSALTVEEVARRLGFDDEAYFYRYFRKHVGSTPGHWRERRRQALASDGAPGLELPF